VSKNPINKEPISYSVREAAAVIGISRSKLYTMLGNGEIQCVRLGGRTLIRRSDIDKLLESNVVAS
jgi:excisionase family DNA binding protein